MDKYLVFASSDSERLSIGTTGTLSLWNNSRGDDQVVVTVSSASDALVTTSASFYTNLQPDCYDVDIGMTGSQVLPSYEVGDTFEVPIRLHTCSDKLTAFQIQIFFDPNVVLAVKDAEEDGKNWPGTITYTYGSPSSMVQVLSSEPSSTAKGDALLLTTLTFEVVGDGATWFSGLIVDTLTTGGDSIGDTNRVMVSGLSYFETSSAVRSRQLGASPVIASESQHTALHFQTQRALATSTLRGDTNGDNLFTVADLDTIKRFSVGGNIVYVDEAAQLAEMDADMDGEIDTIDIVFINSALAKKVRFLVNETSDIISVTHTGCTMEVSATLSTDTGALVTDGATTKVYYVLGDVDDTMIQAGSSGSIANVTDEGIVYAAAAPDNGVFTASFDLTAYLTELSIVVFIETYEDNGATDEQRRFSFYGTSFAGADFSFDPLMTYTGMAGDCLVPTTVVPTTMPRQTTDVTSAATSAAMHLSTGATTGQTNTPDASSAPTAGSTATGSASMTTSMVAVTNSGTSAPQESTGVTSVASVATTIAASIATSTGVDTSMGMSTTAGAVVSGVTGSTAASTGSSEGATFAIDTGPAPTATNTATTAAATGSQATTLAAETGETAVAGTGTTVEPETGTTGPGDDSTPAETTEEGSTTTTTTTPLFIGTVTTTLIDPLDTPDNNVGPTDPGEDDEDMTIIFIIIGVILLLIIIIIVIIIVLRNKKKRKKNRVMPTAVPDGPASKKTGGEDGEGAAGTKAPDLGPGVTLAQEELREFNRLLALPMGDELLQAIRAANALNAPIVAGADIDLLTTAVQENDVAEVKRQLLSGCCSLPATHPFMHRLFLTAARKGQLDEMQMLWAAGADVNQTDRAGNTALHYAGMMEREDLIRWLLDNGAEVAENGRGEPPKIPRHIFVGGKYADAEEALRLLEAGGHTAFTVEKDAQGYCVLRGTCAVAGLREGDLDKFNVVAQHAFIRLAAGAGFTESDTMAAVKKVEFAGGDAPYIMSWSMRHEDTSASKNAMVGKLLQEVSEGVSQ